MYLICKTIGSVRLNWYLIGAFLGSSLKFVIAANIFSATCKFHLGMQFVRKILNFYILLQPYLLHRSITKFVMIVNFWRVILVFLSIFDCFSLFLLLLRQLALCESQLFLNSAVNVFAILYVTLFYLVYFTWEANCLQRFMLLHT